MRKITINCNSPIKLQKAFRVMRLSILFLIVGLNGVFANQSYGQRSLLTLNLNNKTIKEVINEIEKNSEYIFFYNDNAIDMNTKVSVSADKETIQEILDASLKGTSTRYRIADRQIILYSDPGKASESANSKDIAQQQQRRVRGIVKDNLGEPLVGVSIMVKGTTNGVITDVDGSYTIAVPGPESVLIFNFIGYLKEEVVVGQHTNVDILLKLDTKIIEEVVVVAYGTQKAKNITGAMSRLNTAEVEDMPTPNIGQKIQGKFSGLQAYKTSGEPNGGMSYRIRGQASVNGGNGPLIVIDGFPASIGLESLSPDEIETITVLKDAASSALYGSRAANGVILVTTKAAKAGKTNIEFSAYMGWDKVTDRGKPDVMNAQEFAQFKKEIYEDRALYEGYKDGVPSVYQHPEQLGAGTDWYDVLLRTAPTQNYNLSLTSGTNKLKSAVNLSYNNTEGVMLNTYSNRLAVRANNIFQATDRITFGLNISGSYIKKLIYGDLGSGRNLIGSAFLMDPQLKYKNDDGTYPISYSQPGMFANANYYLKLTQRKNPEKDVSGLINAYAEIELIDGLKYKFSANGNAGNNTSWLFTPSTANGGMFNAPPNPASGDYRTTNYENWLLENTLSYNKTFAEKHNVDALLGYTSQKARQEYAQIDVSKFPDDAIFWFNAASTKTGTSDADKWYEWAVLSYLGRLNYNYDSKYLLSLSFRRDGCSRFGSDAKWANFPSASLGWILSEEKFMENINNLSHLKIRGSYGKVGNNNIGNYTYLSTLTTTNYVTNGGITPGRAISNLGNSELTWETTEQSDLGLDLGFFRDRAFFIYDYYNKTTNGLLYQVDIPRQTGFDLIYSNVGEFKFWGHEFSLDTKNFVGEFKWNTSLNVTINRNKAEKLGTNNTPIGGNSNQEDYNRTVVGQPLGQFYGYIYDGVFMNQAELDAGPKHTSSMVGTARMKDVSGPKGVPDGVIDMNDRTFIGNPNPDFLYGMTNTFSYKNFDASMVIAGAVGGDIIDGTYEWTENLDGVFNVRKGIADRWRSEANPGNGEVPSTRSGTTELFRYNNSRWVSDGSYLALKNLTVGYTVPLKSNAYLKDIRIYLSGQNLLMFTKYHGMNPEVNSNGSDGLRQGVDWSSYPIATTYSVGVNIKF